MSFFKTAAGIVIAGTILFIAVMSADGRGLKVVPVTAEEYPNIVIQYVADEIGHFKEIDSMSVKYDYKGGESEDVKTTIEVRKEYKIYKFVCTYKNPTATCRTIEIIDVEKMEEEERKE